MEAVEFYDSVVFQVDGVDVRLKPPEFTALQQILTFVSFFLSPPYCLVRFIKLSR